VADSKLSQAKSFGKDRLSMPNDRDNVAALKSIGEKNIMILEALSRKQFVPYFQPIMNIKTMQVEAYEVLTRIVIGDRVISAAEFIETAEGMGVVGGRLSISTPSPGARRTHGVSFLTCRPKRWSERVHADRPPPAHGLPYRPQNGIQDHDAIP
jgi:hypothetical protein